MDANIPQTTFDCDVTIVGAGPAGATAAYYLAKAGHRVILLDRQTFPRDKVCGDLVGSTAIKELQALNITEQPEFKNAHVINKAAVYIDGKLAISSPMPKISGLTGVWREISRKTLDNWVLDSAKNAGATVYQNVLVTGYELDSKGVNVFASSSEGNQIFHSDLLIGADGSNSLIASKLRGSEVPCSNRITVIRGYYEGVEGACDQVDLHFANESFPGYSWLFPNSQNEADVGVGVLLEPMPQAGQLEDLLAKLMSQDEGLQSRLKNAKLKGKIEACQLNTYNSHLPIVGDRIMLIGEAAGLVNPINGEGIPYALLSGRWAAQTAMGCIGQKDFSQCALNSYAMQVENELGSGFKLSELLVQLMRNRTLNPIWLRAFEVMVDRAKKDPQYANIAGGILSGLFSSTEGLKPQFIMNTLQETTVGTGLKMVNETFGDPSNLPKNVIKITQSGVEAAANTIQNPFGIFKWGIETAEKMAEFAFIFPSSIMMLKQCPRESQASVPQITIRVVQQ
jgi:menaquinone-9 beta-reductase